MNSKTNWNQRLLQVARESPDAPGEMGALLRAVLNRHEAQERIMDFSLAHARMREAIVNVSRMALRCGGLLLTAPPGDVEQLWRAAGITESQAQDFVNLALAYPGLTSRTLRKKHFMITEAEARQVLPILNLLHRGEG